jgi:MFS family permease
MIAATFAAFRLPGYAALWLSGAAAAFARSITLVAIGWTALLVSDSVLAVGATFAARFVPMLIFGIPLGALVDRFDRRTTLVAVNLIAVGPLLAAAVLGGNDLLGLPALIALSVVLGTIDMVQGTAAHSYAFDLAGADGATNAIALGTLGEQLLVSVGSIVGGLALERLGIVTTFEVAAAASALATVTLVLLSSRAGHPAHAPRQVPDFRRSLTLVARNRVVGLIALIVILGEVLGFSSMTLYPVFARDVLHTDAAGLGALSAARSIGAVAGLLLLANLGLGGRGGVLLVIATLAFGLSLVAFSLSSVMVISLAILVVVGALAASLDTLGQSLIQRGVESHERGSAMGVWYFAIGFGPIGHLAIGAAAFAIGAPLALAVSGTTLALAALSLSSVRAIRRLA